MQRRRTLTWRCDDHDDDTPEVPLQRGARQRDRAALAGPLGSGARLLDAEPDRPARRGPARHRRPAARCSCSTCSRTRAARGCTSATRSATSRTDVYARFQRMNGFNVLHAMGYDAFGLPAEQYAVQTGQHPRVTTEQNIATMKRAAACARARARSAPRSGDHATRRTTAGRSGSSCRSTTPGTTTTANRARPIERAGRGVPQSARGRRRRALPFDDLGVASSSASSSTRYRLAYVAEAPVNWCPGWARSSPTRRSPPTAAASAATSPCTGAR